MQMMFLELIRKGGFEVKSRTNRKRSGRVFVTELFLGLFLIVILFTSLSDGASKDSTVQIWDESYQLAQEEYISELIVSSDNDFETGNWTGDGSTNNPYLIESKTVYSIIIIHTNAHFALRNCTIHSVLLDNVTNGLFEACQFQIWDVSLALESSHIKFHNNTMTRRSLALERCTDSEVTSNWFIGESSISLSETNRTLILSNVIDTRYSGIKIGFNCWNTTILNNSIIDAARGLYIYGSSCFSVVNNTIFECWSSGITIDDCSNGLISNNVLQDNMRGLTVDMFNDNPSSTNITITSNIFSENYVNAFDDSVGTIWVSNYYSDYTGFGTYPILGQAGSVDHYPQIQNSVSFILLVITSCVSALAILSCWSMITSSTFAQKSRWLSNRQQKTKPSILFFLVFALFPYVITFDTLAYSRIKFLQLFGFFSITSNRYTELVLLAAPIDWLSIHWMVIAIPHAIVFIIIFRASSKIPHLNWNEKTSHILPILWIVLLVVSGLYLGVVYVSVTILLGWIAIRFILDRMNGLDTDS